MRFVFACVLPMLLLAGCGGQSSGPELIAVTGTVRVKGTLVEGAIVTFIPMGDTPGGGGSGRTNAEGKYTLRYVRGGNGVPAGQYKVVISRRLLPGNQPVPKDYDVPEMESSARESLPARYSDPEQTELGANVTDDLQTPIDFDL